MHQMGNGLMKAVSVGVGLDDRHIFDVRRQRGADELQIALEHGQVDFGPAAQRGR